MTSSVSVPEHTYNHLPFPRLPKATLHPRLPAGSMRTFPTMRAVWTVLSLACAVSAQTLSDNQVQQVKSNLASVAKQRYLSCTRLSVYLTRAILSWEVGARMQALLSLDTPSFSTLNATVPPPHSAPSSLSDVLDSAKAVLSNVSSSSGPHSLFPSDGSAGDPASTGIGILIANWTGQSGNYSGAAQSEVEFLLGQVPRWSNGAISQRTSEPQLWSVWNARCSISYGSL